MPHPHGRSIQPQAVLWPLGLGTALSLMGDATLYAVLPTHAADAGITMVSVGIILGANRAIRLLTNGPIGLAYDRWPRRLLLLPALLLGAFSTAIYAALPGFWPLLAGRLLWGLAWSGIWVGGAAIVLDVTTIGDRGRWTGLYQTWFFLGSALGSAVGGVLTDLLGYAGAMWIGAAISALGWLAAMLFLPETRASAPTHGAQALASAAPLALRANHELLAAVTIQGLNRLALVGILTATLALIVEEQIVHLGLGVGAAAMTGMLLAGRTVFSMVAAPLCGSLSDRLGSRWRVLLWTTGAGMAGFALMVWGSLAGVLAGAILTAIASGAIQTLATTLTGDTVSPAQRGRAIGLLHTAGDLGSAIGPVAAYALLPWLSIEGVYVLCTMALGAGLSVAAWLVRRERAPQPAKL